MQKLQSDWLSYCTPSAINLTFSRFSGVLEEVFEILQNRSTLAPRVLEKGN